jgi:hypothetical protein
MRLHRVDRWSHLLAVEDLPPPIDVEGEDPPVAAKALVSRDAALHWPSRHIAN